MNQFFPDFFDHVGTQHHKKAKVNSKLMASQTGKQIMTIHILPNISTSKGNPDNEIWSINRNNILKKDTKSVVEKLVPNLLIKNQNLAYLWINSLRCYKFCFYCMSKLRSTKRRSGTSLSTSFSAYYLKKNISLLIFY